MTEAVGGDLNSALLGHYRVEALIGRGGMGEVYRARDTTLGRAVAIKVLPAHLVENAERLARFVQEARAASALNHPHVITIYEIGSAALAREGSTESRSVHYIAMELVAGETLRTLIDQRRLDTRRTLEIFTQAADALAAAHAAGVVHRDLKPENLMVADGGYVKVLDFGLAKLKPNALSELTSQTTVMTAGSTPGLVLGTAGYMSPEQAQGRSVDHRSDIFSFGCVLYEAATGVRAFGGSAIDTLHAIVNSEPATMTTYAPSVPGELQRIVRKCLAKHPDDRYQSMKELAIDLRDLRRQLDSSPPVAVAPPRSRWSYGAAAGIAAFLIAAIVVGWLAWGRSSQAPAAPLRIERLAGIEASTDAAISPDGKYVTYVESGGGVQRLMLRQLEGIRAIELVPSAPVGYWGITFSPDSGAIFYAIKSPANVSGSLYRIPLLGGEPERLLDGIDCSVTFSPDGKQIAYLRAEYPHAGASALMLANVDGSQSRALATRNAPAFFTPGFFVSAAWSPDGRHIVAPIRNAATRDAGLVAFTVADGAARPIGRRFVEATNVTWLRDGSGLLFVGNERGLSRSLGGQLFLQPWPDGPPRQVTDDVVDYRNVTVSADGSTIVSVGTDPSSTIWNIPLDGREPEKISSSRFDGTLGIAWLGSRIVFTTMVRRERQIWVMDADGSNRRALTNAGDSAWPRLSHDGRFIAFFGSRDGHPGIWRMDPDGGNVGKLADVADASYLDITPDDRWITFTSIIDATSSTWRVSTDGGAPERLIQFFERATISHDGTRMVGVYRPAGGAIGLAVLPLTGGNPLWLKTPEAMASGGGIMQWNHADDGILYTTAERSNLNLYRLADGTSTRVTRFVEDTLLRGALSPDGRSLLVTRVAASQEPYLITNFR